jgi:hypothetical protein
MLMGHHTGLAINYYRPNGSDIIDDYIKHASDVLTVNPTHRQKQRIKELETEQDQEIAQQTQEIVRLKTQIDKLNENNLSEVLTLKSQVDEINEPDQQQEKRKKISQR